MDKWKCFLCGGQVHWQSDFMFEDYGYIGNGIVQNFTCSKCGAEYEVRSAIDEQLPCNPEEPYRQLTWEDQ